MELTNSKRILYAATYVTTSLTPEEQKSSDAHPAEGDAFVKFNALRAMGLTTQHLDQISSKLGRVGAAQPSRLNLEPLVALAREVADPARQVSTLELAPKMARLSFDAIGQLADIAVSADPELAEKVRMVRFFLKQRTQIHPIGRIHLERIEMYPAGVQKGELVFSVPMAPGETVTISHKEWATTAQEFEDIVQDYFESYSERGVAEKTDASMANESDSKHSSATTFGASLSGTYAGVTLTTTLGLSSTNDEKLSVKRSMEKHREVTEKASARSRKEHKVSMKIETKSGTEDRSGKTITNPSTNAVRIDYYRMMRKWRADLYRYGLRQTYDITIPLPGVRLWALHERIAELDRQLLTPFPFGLEPADLGANWEAKARELNVPLAVVPAPPEPELQSVLPPVLIDIPEAEADARFGKVDFEVPAGYELKEATAFGKFQEWPGRFGFEWLAGSSNNIKGSDEVTGDLSKLVGRTGALGAPYKAGGIRSGIMILTLKYRLTPGAFRSWQLSAWNAIRASAEARYREEQLRLQEERDRLSRLLNGKDTLSLRRLEREELLRLVTQWLMGPGYPIAATTSVEDTVSRLLRNERDFQQQKVKAQISIAPVKLVSDPLSPTFTKVTEDAWFDAVMFGEQVKFIQQAIEWENLLYFLYPYFWGSETVGRDKLLFEHPDPEHERFLRAGYVRVVLPVRPGFEEDFTDLMERGALGGNRKHPYITIATEIANFARTNYSGVPPANPEEHARPLLFPEQRATWDTMQLTMKELDAFMAKNGRYPAKLNELPVGPGHTFSSEPVDAWGNPFEYRTPGLGSDYDLVSLGANNKPGGVGLDADISSAAGASLVATWFEYTPTSALDIAVDTEAKDMA